MAAGVEPVYREPGMLGGEGLLGGEIPWLFKLITLG